MKENEYLEDRSDLVNKFNGLPFFKWQARSATVSATIKTRCLELRRRFLTACP
jgi:hypothetical protein